MQYNKRFWSILTAIVMIYSGCILFFASDFPIADDYDQQFGIVEKLLSGDSFSSLLFTQHNEHRLFTTYIVPILSYLIVGKIELVYSFIWAILLLIGIYFSLIRLISGEKNKIVALIIALFLFVPYSPDSIFVGSIVPFYAVILFGILSMTHLIDFSRRSIAFSLVCVFLAINSMASGVFVVLSGLFYLITSRKFLTYRGIFWILISLLFVFHFFQDYETYKQHTEHPSPFYAFYHPYAAINYLVHLMGGSLTIIPETGIRNLIITGTLVLIIVKLIKKRKEVFYAENKALWCALYLCMVCGIVMLGRVGFEDVQQALSLRYIIYTKCFWALILMILYQSKSISKEILNVMFGMAIVYFIVQTSISLLPLRQFSTGLQNDAVYALFYDNPAGLIYPRKKIAGEKLIKGIKGSYFHPSLAKMKVLKNKGDLNFIQNGEMKWNIEKMKNLGPYFYFQGWAFITDVDIADSEYFVALASADFKKWYLFDAKRSDRTDVEKAFPDQKMDLTRSGFKAVIDTDLISADYQETVWLLIRSKDGEYYSGQIDTSAY